MGGSIEQQDDVPTSSMTIAVRIIVLVLAVPTTLVCVLRVCFLDTPASHMEATMTELL